MHSPSAKSYLRLILHAQTNVIQVRFAFCILCIENGSAKVTTPYRNLNVSKPFVCCVQWANAFPYSQTNELATAGHLLLRLLPTFAKLWWHKLLPIQVRSRQKPFYCPFWSLSAINTSHSRCHCCCCIVCVIDADVQFSETFLSRLTLPQTTIWSLSSGSFPTVTESPCLNFKCCLMSFFFFTIVLEFLRIF